MCVCTRARPMQFVYMVEFTQQPTNKWLTSCLICNIDFWLQVVILWIFMKTSSSFLICVWSMCLPFLLLFWFETLDKWTWYLCVLIFSIFLTFWSITLNYFAPFLVIWYSEMGLKLFTYCCISCLLPSFFIRNRLYLFYDSLIRTFR